MDPNRFIVQKKEDWNQLEVLLERVEKYGFRRLSAKEAHLLGRLYRRLASDLATVQAQVASHELERYLNALMARAFPILYGQEKTPFRTFVRFWTHELPSLFWETRWLHLLAFAIFSVGMLSGLFAYSLDPQATAFFRPAQVDHFERSIRGGHLKNGKASASMGRAPEFSAKIMTNNIRVAFLAFALGLTFGIGTFVVLFYNGLMLGTYAAVAHKYAIDLAFWSLILPHGVLELSAIFLAGGAGFVLARGLFFPGEYTRLLSLQTQAKVAVRLTLGLVPILIVAGLIEGFVTPAPFLEPVMKLAFAGLTIPLLFWFLLPRRKDFQQQEVVG